MVGKCYLGRCTSLPELSIHLNISHPSGTYPPRKTSSQDLVCLQLYWGSRARRGLGKWNPLASAGTTARLYGIGCDMSHHGSCTVLASGAMWEAAFLEIGFLNLVLERFSQVGSSSLSLLRLAL